MYIITNTSKERRKFLDRFTGKYVVLNAGESTFSKKAIESNSVFKVEKTEMVDKKEKTTHIEKKEKKDQLNKQEVKKDDSNSS